MKRSNLITVVLFSSIIFSLLGCEKTKSEPVVGDNPMIEDAQLGKLMLNASDLQLVLDEDPDLAGIVFRLKSTDKLDVGIEKVYWQEQGKSKTLVSQKTDLIRNEKVALYDDPDSETVNKSELVFEFSEFIPNNEFVFAMASRDQLQMLLSHKRDKFYLQGSKVHFGKERKTSGDHFTFSLSVPEGIENTDPRLLGVPGSFLAHPCPPVWWTIDK